MTLKTDAEAVKTAAQCRHYAMCKIDYLGTGICRPGREKGFVSYYPQGRMDIYHALEKNLIPVTPRLKDIADTCTLCGHCDKQCYFVTELRIGRVMRALKEYVDAVPPEQVVPGPEPDDFLRGVKEIVGSEWASSDPAVCIAYAADPSPGLGPCVPRAVAMPESTRQVSDLIKICNREDIPFVVRGNGSSVIGMVFSEGLVLDMGRMKEIEIDRDHWSARIGAGVAAFDLQKAADREGMRACTAETSALICANIMCSGIFSTFSASYGTAADHYINATFVDHEGEIFSLDQRNAPNLYGFKHEVRPTPAICTEALVKLYPTTPDEAGVLVPFADIKEATAFAHNLGVRRIGLAVAVLGLEYVSTFIAPTRSLADRVKRLFTDTLGIQCFVFVVGDQYALNAVREMSEVVLENDLVRSLFLGLPRLTDDRLTDLIGGMEADTEPYRTVFRPEMIPLLEAILDPSPETLADAVDPQLRDFFVDLYSRPEVTDMRWLNMFRILSPRMGRKKHIISWILYLPIDRGELIEEINTSLAAIGDRHGVDHDFGFLTPLDFGKRGVLEYDYFVDQTDPEDEARMLASMAESEKMIEDLCSRVRGVRWIKYLFNQGFSRKEGFLYT